MTLTLDLKPDLEAQLRQEAAREGVPLEDLALQLLDERLLAVRNAAAIALLRSWREQGDPEEQRETGEFLLRALDEDRLSDRKLFP